MTKSNTKRALLSSVLAMILCLGLLIGTTFAWFTDSATSGNNKIVAGTLDVDLLMGTAVNTYTSIAGKDAAIFGEGSLTQDNAQQTLWEPGKTQIVYLAVANNGNLDLKYNIALNVVDGGLIGSLEYAIVDGAQYGDLNNYTDWATLKANAQTGDVVAGTTVAAPNGAITVAEKIEYFALAVHMKEDADNKYQGKDITIDVTVLATQLASEYDSFGNQYDANAWTEVAEAPVPDAEGAVNVWTAEQLAGVMSNVKGIKTINIMENIDLSGRTWVPANLWDPENTALLTINGNGHTISNMAVASAGKGGFIGSNSRNITINDLTFKTASVTASGNFAGTVIGYAYGNITLNNVDVVDSVISGTAEFSIRIGGLIGFVPQDGGTLTLTNCDVTGSTVSGYHNVGAMVGATMTTKTVTIESCTATNNTLMYVSSNVGAFAFGASTNGYTEYAPASGFAAENNKVVKCVTNATQLQEALTLGRNIVLAENITLEAHLSSSSAGDINIDGAGNTLTLRGIYSVGGKNVTLSNMTLVDNNPSDYTIYNQGGKVELTNVTYSSNINKAFQMVGGGDVILTNCNISGVVTGTYSASNIWCGDGRTVTVNGGNYGSIFINASNGAGVLSAGKITVEAGTISKLILETEKNTAGTGYKSAVLVQNGGTITELVENPQNYDLTGLTKLN